MKTEKAITCPTCGTLNDADAKRCQTCQRLLLQPFSPIPSDKFKVQCDLCGTINDSGNIYCNTCGGVLTKTSNTSASSTFLTDNKSFLLSQILKRIPIIIAILALIVSLIATSFATHTTFTSNLSPSASPAISLPHALGVISITNKESIGINDGSFPPFDIGRPDETYKQQAYQALKNNNPSKAISSWNNALSLESNDAEALIYTENLHIYLSGKAFISIVIGVNFAPSFPDQNDEEILQGAYVAQHEFNQNHALQIRILIANASKLQYITPVAQQLVAITQQQKIIGVVGWGTSSSTLNAIKILRNADIPLITPSATSDELTAISPNFFRIVPSNTIQAVFAADFALKQLNASKAVVFVDRTDVYSQTLATAFERAFIQNGGNPVHEEVFITGKTHFATLVNDAIQYKPDVLYFTSASSSDAVAFENVLPSLDQYPNLHMIGEDMSYLVTSNNYGRSYFTSLAFPDAWEIATSGKQNNPFFSNYIAAFDPSKLRESGTYGYERPSGQAILAYDASKIVQLALQLSSTSRTPTSQDILNNIPKITGANAYQGISGQISFDSNHDPINKAVLMLSVSPEGYRRLVATYGCYTKGNCG